MNTYSTRSLFDVARNDRLNVRLVGIWYRRSPIEYALMHAGKSERFSDVQLALEAFEQKVDLEDERRMLDQEQPY